MPAILFGSISTLSDTSELQRRSFNEAFAESGLDWRWDQEEYRALLTGNGGAQRIADEAERTGTEVDATAVHAAKSAKFQAAATDGLSPRAGVAETIRAAKENGLKVGLVTTTVPENITALLAGLGSAVRAEDFDVIVDLSAVETSKPDPASYRYALEQLGESAADCVAIEDNVGGVQAAQAAGLTCVAFPNENTAGHDFAAADQVVDQLDPDQLRQLTSASS